MVERWLPFGALAVGQRARLLVFGALCATVLEEPGTISGATETIRGWSLRLVELPVGANGPDDPGIIRRKILCRDLRSVARRWYPKMTDRW
jgi:hypothetical protein